MTVQKQKVLICAPLSPTTPRHTHKNPIKCQVLFKFFSWQKLTRDHGSKLTVASSKFATWKFSLLPGKTVGSKKLLSGIVPWTLLTLCCECPQCKLGLVVSCELSAKQTVRMYVNPDFCWSRKILWKCCLLNMLSLWRFNPWHTGNIFCCHVDAFCYLLSDQVATTCYLWK